MVAEASPDVLSIVVTAATALVSGLTAGIVGVFSWAKSAIKTEKDECAERVERLEARIDKLEAYLFPGS